MESLRTKKNFKLYKQVQKEINSSTFDILNPISYPNDDLHLRQTRNRDIYQDIDLQNKADNSNDGFDKTFDVLNKIDSNYFKKEDNKKEVVKEKKKNYKAIIIISIVVAITIIIGVVVSLYVK